MHFADLTHAVAVMPSLQHALRNPSQTGSLTSPPGPVQKGAKPFEIIAAGGNPWRQRRRRSPKRDRPASAQGPFRLGWVPGLTSLRQSMLLCLMKQQADAFGGLGLQFAHLFRTLMLLELTKMS